MASWTQKKLTLAIGGSALGLCLLAGGGIYYTEELIAEIDAQVVDKEAAIAKSDARIRQVPNLERDVIILRENLGEYVKILPDQKELTDFVRMLNQFNRQSGVKSSSLVNTQRQGGKNERFTPIEYTYEMTATLWQVMKFMNLVENFERFVGITEFSITSGSKGNKVQTRDGDVVHTVKMTLQTYAYNGKVDAKDVEIPEHQKLREQLREEIYKRMQAIRLDRYEHRGEQGRRDVLVDPRDRGDVNAAGPSQEEQREALERNIDALARLREIQDKIGRANTTLFEQYSLEKNLKEGIDKFGAQIETESALVSFPPLRLRWSREVVAPYNELRNAVLVGKESNQPKDPYLPESEMRQLVADLTTDCHNGQLDQARSRYELVMQRIAVPETDARYPLALAAKAWHVKAITAIDFKALDLKVQGVVVNPDGRSGVLLNGETYEEGEYVSDELLVKQVQEEQIWFVFRGLTLVRTM